MSKYQYWERRCCDLGKSTADEEEPEGWGDDGDCGGGGGGGDYRVHEAFATAPVTDADLESSPQFLRSLRELLGFVKGFVRVPPHVVLKVQEQVGCGGDVNEALTLLHDTLATRRYVQLQLLSHSRAEADAELARKAAAGGEDARAMIAQLQALESSEHGGFSGQIQKKMEEVATVQRAIKSDAAPILDRHALDPLRHTAEADFVKLLPVSGGGKKAAAAAIGGSGGAGDSCGARAMEVDGGGGDGGGASAAAISSELTLEWDALQEVFDSYARQAEREERKAARQARRGGGDAAAGAADDGDDDGSSDGGYDSDSSSDSLFEAKGDHPAPHPDDPEHDKIVREAEREAVQRLMEKRKKARCCALDVAFAAEEGACDSLADLHATRGAAVLRRLMFDKKTLPLHSPFPFARADGGGWRPHAAVRCSGLRGRPRAHGAAEAGEAAPGGGHPVHVRARALRAAGGGGGGTPPGPVRRGHPGPPPGPGQDIPGACGMQQTIDDILSCISFWLLDGFSY